MPLAIRSAVSVLAMKDAQDLDGEFLFGQEEDAVITDAEAELRAGRLKFFQVARAGGEITVDGVQNAQGGLAVDGAEVGASFRRPENGFFRHGAGLVGREAELAENVFVRDALATIE